MAGSDLINAGFDKSAIPSNAPDTLEDVDDMSMRQQRKERFRQDTRYRRYLANWVMIIIPAWLLFVIIVLILCGLSVLSLEKEVIITLLATTTANILALAFILLKGVYPESKEK